MSGDPFNMPIDTSRRSAGRKAFPYAPISLLTGTIVFYTLYWLGLGAIWAMLTAVGIWVGFISVSAELINVASSLPFKRFSSTVRPVSPYAMVGFVAFGTWFAITWCTSLFVAWPWLQLATATALYLSICSLHVWLYLLGVHDG